MPLVTSLVSRLSALRDPPPRLWASAAAGVAVVAGAFAIGFYSAQGEITTGDSAAAMPAPACGANLVPLSGGQCLDRVEVTAGDYQACVRSGSCEPVQREFPARRLHDRHGGGARADRRSGGGDPGSGVCARRPDAAQHDERRPVCPGWHPRCRRARASEPGYSLPCRARRLSSRVGSRPHLRQPPRLPPRPLWARAWTRRRTATPGCRGARSYAINCVTYQQARRYCEWRGGRLPTRFEWERAAAEPALSGAENLIGGLSEWTFEPHGG